MKTLFVVLVICNFSFAGTVQECLNESIETSIVLKVAAMTHSVGGSHCGDVEIERVRDLGEQRENKIRFRDKVVRAYKRTKLVDLNNFADIDEENPGKGDEVRTCSYITLKNNSAIRDLYAEKYPKLKDCPTAINALKKSLRDSQVLSVPLYEVCGIVLKAEDEMKNALDKCKTEEPVAEVKKPEMFQRAFINFGNRHRSRAARATEQ